MGLDITFYRQLKPADNVELDSDGNPVDWYAYFAPGSLVEMTERDFPGRAVGIDGGVIYTFGTSGDFRAGSYGGYGQWRNWLATVVGYENARAIWELDDDAPKPPFYELINFSDCEGVIGTEVAAKLAQDFQSHTPIGDEWQLKLYAKWREAFEVASDGGAVRFY